MRTLQQALSLYLCITLSSACFAAEKQTNTLPSSTERFKDVEYIYTPDGKEKPRTVGGRLTFDTTAKTITFSTKKLDVLAVSDASVTSALYERTSRPRYAAGLLIAWPLLFTKTKKHYLTLQYKTETGEGKYALFHLDKGNVRRILAATEATLSKKVERTEER